MKSFNLPLAFVNPGDVLFYQNTGMEHIVEENCMVIVLFKHVLGKEYYRLGYLNKGYVVVMNYNTLFRGVTRHQRLKK